MNTRRTLAHRNLTSEHDEPSSEGAGSGKYPLAARSHDSTRYIEVSVSVRSGDASHLDELGGEDAGDSRGLHAIADEGGLRLATDRLLPIGSRVALEIRLSAWTKLCVFGHVRWHDTTPAATAAMGVGISLDDLPAAARCQLLAHLGIEQSETASDVPTGE